MAEDPINREVQLRKELEQYHIFLERVSTTLNNATREEDPVPVGVHQCETLLQQLDSTITLIEAAAVKLAGLEEEENVQAEDLRTRDRLNLQWTQLHSLLKKIITLEKAEKISNSLHKSIKRIEKLQMENPTKDYKGAVSTLNSQMINFREALDGTILPEDHDLWTHYEEYEERIFSMLAAEPAPPDVKDRGKAHDKGAYKVSALASLSLMERFKDGCPFGRSLNMLFIKR